MTLEGTLLTVGPFPALPPAHLPWTALPILQPHQWALACEGLPISRWES